MKNIYLFSRHLQCFFEDCPHDGLVAAWGGEAAVVAVEVFRILVEPIVEGGEFLRCDSIICHYKSCFGINVMNVAGALKNYVIV